MKKDTKKIVAEIILILLACISNNELLFALLWVLLHEVAHMLIALKFGCKFHNLEVHIFGVKAELSDIDALKDNEKILVYLAGVILNIVAALLFYLLYRIYPWEFLIISARLNIGLAFFNLLPAYPLDGSRIFEIILSKKYIYKKSQKIIIYTSYIIAIVFVLTDIYIYYWFKKINFTMLIAALIIFYITQLERKTYMYITMGNIIKKRKRLLKNKYIENKTISVYYNQGLINVLSLVDRNKFNTFYILDDDLHLIYILNEDELIEALKIYGNISIIEYIKKINK
ncbi:site-2 protease family protein [Caproiciproducens sp. MSJ-32]|uniref:site-2 protease family protein n=1 Tax=Caproiciproducens sp. MSJ-32 TaxID=2841527 RepID=UPI001C1111C2|nr:site-2 protease family protein [Caproiciproducens sp. MSJ-32]MBU5455930.1 site-2 protease family protein [Caproiciproducens sp. MSJ-32]